MRAGSEDLYLAKDPAMMRLKIGVQMVCGTYLIFEGVHVVASWFAFPTTAEYFSLLVLSLGSTVPILTLITGELVSFGILHRRVWQWPMKLLAGIYIFTRVFLVFGLLRNLSYLPADAYINLWPQSLK